MAVSIPCVTLNTGHAMPVLGFGTSSSRTPEHLPATVLHAVRLGYRHLDTASFYGTEHAVGAAASEAVRSGFVASLADLFVTSKLPCIGFVPQHGLSCCHCHVLSCTLILVPIYKHPSP
jgi:3''-deamino-3''-oxonicotianamine reductase